MNKLVPSYNIRRRRLTQEEADAKFAEFQAGRDARVQAMLDADPELNQSFSSHDTDEESSAAPEESNAPNQWHLKNSEEMKMLLDVKAREIDVLHCQVTKLQEENLQLRDKTVAESQQTLRACTALEDKEQQTKILNEKLQILEEELEKYKKTLTETEAQKEKLSIDLTLAKSTIDDYQRLTMHLEKGSKEKTEFLQLEKQMESREESHKKEVAQLKGELQTAFKKCKELERENVTLNMKIREDRNFRDAERRERQEEENHLRKQIEALKREVNSSSVADLQMAVQMSKIRESNLEQLLDDARSRIQSLQEEVRMVTARGSSDERLQVELLQACSESKSQRAQISALQTLLQEKKQVEDLLRNKVNELTSQMDEKETEIYKLRSKLQQAKPGDQLDLSQCDDQKVQDLNQEIRNLREVNASLQETIGSLEEQLQSMKDEVKLKIYRYTEESERDLKKQVKAVEEKYQALLNVKDSEKERIEDELVDTKSAYLKLTDAVNESSQRILELQKEHSDKCNQDREVLEEKLKKLQLENDVLTSRLQDLPVTSKEDRATSTVEQKVTATESKETSPIKPASEWVLRSDLEPRLQQLAEIHENEVQELKKRELALAGALFDAGTRIANLKDELCTLSATDRELRRKMKNYKEKIKEKLGEGLQELRAAWESDRDKYEELIAWIRKSIPTVYGRNCTDCDGRMKAIAQVYDDKIDLVRQELTKLKKKS